MKNDPKPSNPSSGRKEAVCGNPLALPLPWLAALAFWSEPAAVFDCVLAADWSALLLPVWVLVAL